MKIAVDLTPVRPDGSTGGATGVAVELLKELMKNTYVKLVLLCATWNNEYLREIFGNKVEYKLTVGEGKKKYSMFVKRVLQKWGVVYWYGKNTLEYEADLLFCPFSAIDYKIKGIPAVSTIHDIQHEFYPQFFAPEELQHRRKFYKKIVDKAEKVICVSDYTKDTFCEIYGYDPKNAVTVYNAIQKRFCEEDKDILNRLMLDSEEYIVFPANFWEHKNHKLLLNAFGMYAMQHSKCKLVLTGNTLGQEDYYTQVIEAMQLKGRVIITGYLNEKELYAVLNNAKGLIYPSLFEGFGIPLVEAMQMNKLIASSNLTSLPEVGCDSVFYFNPKKPDEILKGIEYLFQSDMTENIEREYKNTLNKYVIETMAKEYMSVFKQTIKDGIVDKETACVYGIYGDGWSKDIIDFQITKHKGDILHIIFRVPEHIKGKILIKTGKKVKKYQYEYNQSNEIVEILQNDYENIIIKLPSTWNPEKISHSGDDRELGIMVEDMELMTRAGIEEINIV